MNLQVLSRLISVIFIISLVTSCVSRKSMAYFQGLDKFERSLIENNLSIQPDDVLTIRVSSPQQEAALPFNLTKSVGGIGAGANANVELETYLVSDEGTIKFPVLGEIKVEGLTNFQLSNKIENKLEKYLQDPIVNVRILNFQVTVLGEVKNPGTFPVEDDHLSLSKALGLAGDIPVTGRRDNVLVMREINGITTYSYLDLTDAEVINSPYYYLRQNDVVYVEPRGPKLQSASYVGTAATYLSIASVALSLIFLFTN